MKQYSKLFLTCYLSTLYKIHKTNITNTWFENQGRKPLVSCKNQSIEETQVFSNPQILF